MNDRKIDLDRNIFLVAFSAARLNWIPCAAVTLLMLASNAVTGVIDAPLPLAVLRALLLMAAGFSAFQVLVSDGRISGLRAVATAEGRFPWRYAGVMLMILSPILVLGTVWTSSGTGIGPEGLGEIVFGVIMVLTYAVLYILLGTALPAIAEHGEAPLAEAFRRGRSNYVAIGRSFLFGVWLFRVGALLFMILIGVLGVPTDFYPPGSDVLVPSATVAMMAYMFTHVFAECLTAVVLVRAYRRFP